MTNTTHDLFLGGKSKRQTLPAAAVFLFALAIALSQGCTSSSHDVKNTSPNQRSQEVKYTSADQAVDSLVASLRTHDRNQVLSVLGKGGEQIISSGDEVADWNGIDEFLRSYDEKHQLKPNDDGSMTLVVGNQEWPEPVPLVKDEKTNTWSFDTQAGEQEILNRRIGRNELTVIQVCQAIADAQREYAQRDPDGDGIAEYAEKFLSDPGRKNGLFWNTAEGEQPSPLGELVADAVEQGYTSHTDAAEAPQPYYGYFYHMLLSQGPNTPGGAIDYVVDGKMIGGFAAVAYPATYGNSGIMTFMVDYHGDVYQKDLGPSTRQTASAMNVFNPGGGWQKVEQMQPPQP